MQRGIDSYFNKVVGTKKCQPVVTTKRKALLISSDEEESPKKTSNSTPNKKPKVSKKLKQVKSPAAPTKSETPLKPADVTALFGGEASRENKKKTTLAFPSTNDDVEEITNPQKNASKGTKHVSPTAAKKSHKDEDKQTQHKTALSKLVDELSESEISQTSKKQSKEDDASIKKTPVKTRSNETNEELGEKISIKMESEDEFIPKSDKKPVQEKKLNRSAKKESPSTAIESTKLKESKQHDLESSIVSDEERFERKRMAAVLYQKFKNRQSVINPGSKEIPKGKPNCLAGLSFLVTGILESIERDEANSIIKELGGKVSSTVGKRLNYIIAGEEAGPKKMSDAESLGIPILSVDDFFNLIKEKSGDKVKILKEPPESSKNTTSKKTPTKRKHNKIQDSPVKIKKEVETTDNKIEKNIEKEIEIEVKAEKSPIIKNERIEIKPETKIVFENNIAWVDKYKPTSVKQIIGQQGPASNSTKLLNWLTKWHTNQSGSKKLQKPNPWAKNDDGSYFKAALLSGPPGVGKTTTATLVCKELGYDIIEFNASDTRSKRLLKEEVSELLSNKSLHGYFSGNTQVVTKKHVLIMDEVDGMAGNEDRGGIQELISLIKDAHVPIICMCNDRNHQKMRSLVNYCYDLRFNRPRLEQIKGFIRSICFKEKIKMSSEKIDEIIMATNNDIRQSVNHICLLSSGENIEIQTKGVKTAQKDLKMGPWEVVRKVFSAEDRKTMSLADKSDLFFHDYSMAPLFVQQNYLMVSPVGPKSEVLQKVALTADALSLGDLVDRRIRSNSAWTLLPVQAVLSSVLPGDYMQGHFTGQINFPGWLGKYSRTNKRSRLAQEIHDHTRIRTSGSRLSIRMDYAPFLLSNIVRPLKEHGLEGVEESLKVLQEYRLLREDIDSLIELTTWPGKKSLMEAVDGRVKAALTRSYNKEVLPYSYSAVTTVKKKKENNEGDDLIGIMETEEGEITVVESEEEDNSLDNDNLIKAKKKPVASTSKTSSKASTSKKANVSAKPKTAGRSKK